MLRSFSDAPWQVVTPDENELIAAMKESARLRTSQKAYRSHVARILDDTLANEINELALTLFENRHHSAGEEERANHYP